MKTRTFIALISGMVAGALSPVAAQLGSLIVTVTEPPARATVAGTVTVSASVTTTGSLTVQGVQFVLDGVNLGAEDTSAPFSISWNSRTTGNGLHTLTAVARDLVGVSWSSDPTPVTVSNDLTPPTITMTAPAAGAVLAGPISVTATASDNVGVVGVQFSLDNNSLGAELTTSPYTVPWDTAKSADGTHTLTAVARDAAGNKTTSSAVAVTVDNASPAVAVTSPSSGATLSSTVTVTAGASDNVAVAGVQFVLDGANLGAEDTSAPYSAAWDTRTASGGPHTLAAIARDTAGHRTTSTAVTVNVFNGSGITMRIEDGNTAIEYAGAWNLGNQSRPWSGGTASVGFAVNQNATLTFTGTGVTWFSSRSPFSGIANVYLDGALVTTVDAYDTTETIGAKLFTAANLPFAQHTLRLEVTRTKNPASADYLVIVDAFDVFDAAADATPPTVTITAPEGGKTVSGTLPIVATAADANGVASVTFFVDGAQLGTPDTIPPYSMNWTTTAVADGSHTLTAVGRDSAGNSTTSAGVTVTVSNAAPPVTATSTRLENTDLSIIYSDGCVTCGQAPSWYHGSRSRMWSAGTASFNRSDGARATLTFTGTAVRWIGFRAAWAGIARVYVDGAFVREIDLYSSTEQVIVPVFETSGLSAGTHTITVESTGRKNPAAEDFAVVVDAFDVAPAFAPPVQGTRAEETASPVTFTGGWTQGDTTETWSGGTAALSSTTGDRMAYVFDGTTVTWIGFRGPARGIARVYLDGAFQAQVDTYAALPFHGIVYSATGLAPARHRLEIEVTGQRNANATGSAVAVDAFDVRTRLEETDPAVTYSGTWGFNFTDRNWSETSLYTASGTVARSGTAGASAQVAFGGTAATWIGFRAPWVGIADVYLDGVFAERIDLYSATEQVQVPLFTATGLAAGPHTLRIDVTGQKNPASSTALVMIDAFDVAVTQPAPVVTRAQETDAAITYSANWSQSPPTPLWTGERAKESLIVGAQATFTFTGTAVRWIGEHGFGTGVARVSLDGQFITQLDTHASFQDEYQKALLTLTGLTPGAHALTIEVVGRGNEPAGTTVERIVIDAFDVW
jgi:hypothetical protein